MRHIKLYEKIRNGHDDIQYNLDMLKSYIKILKNEIKNGRNCEFAIKYFIILYNFIIIEQGFIDDYILKRDQINLNLKLKKLTKCDDILDKFAELYDPNSIVRNNLEKFDTHWEIIKEYLKIKPNLYIKLLKTNLQQTKNEVEMFINLRKYNL